MGPPAWVDPESSRVVPTPRHLGDRRPPVICRWVTVSFDASARPTIRSTGAVGDSSKTRP